MTTATLDKKTYPLMMHLSILPKYDLNVEKAVYDTSSQTSNTTAMAGSWCTRANSTGGYGWTPDDDSQQDD